MHLLAKERHGANFAASHSLVPCFTPVRSPESGGVSKVFVKTLKRDYARVQPRPGVLTVLAQLPAWIEDYNENHHATACGYARLASSSAANRNQPRVRFNEGTFTYGVLGARTSPSADCSPVP